MNEQMMLVEQQMLQKFSNELQSNMMMGKKSPNIPIPPNMDISSSDTWNLFIKSLILETPFKDGNLPEGLPNSSQQFMNSLGQSISPKDESDSKRLKFNGNL